MDLLGRRAGVLRVCLLCAEVVQVRRIEKHDRQHDGSLFAGFSEVSRRFVRCENQTSSRAFGTIHLSIGELFPITD